MSGWEIFTWFNVAVLAVGSVIVFALFLRQLRTIVPPRDDPGDEDRAAPQE